MMPSRFSRVLIVDDSAVTRKVVRRYLLGMNLENVDEAANGEEAIRNLKSRHYSLVVSDLNMAPINGLELLRFVRDTPTTATTPFVMATSSAKFSDVARDNGVTHYLIKPFDAAMLAAKISAAFDGVARAKFAQGQAVKAAASQAADPRSGPSM